MRSPGPEVDAWAALVAQFRRLSDALAATGMPVEQMQSLTADLTGLTRQLAEYRVPERERFSGRCLEQPGRGHPFLVPFVADETTSTSVRGRVTFGAFHLGGNTAAHGGTQPLLFDDLLGIMVSSNTRDRIRTASLTVNYRAIAPVEVELRAEATIDRVDGRKTWATGRLWRDDRLLADASGLFVALRPEQP